MKTHLLLIALLISLLIPVLSFAQESDYLTQEQVVNNKIEELEKKRIDFENSEKERLERVVARINGELERGEITEEEAKNRKKERADKAAASINAFSQLISAEIEYVKLDPYYSFRGASQIVLDDSKIIPISTNIKNESKRYKKDIRTKRSFTFSFGYKFIDGENLDINDASYSNNNHFSLGYNWITRIDTNNHFRFTYGIEFLSLGSELNGNRIFSPNTDGTQIAPIGFNVEKAKFRQDQIIVPFHLEIGGTNKKEYDDGRVRFNTEGKFNVGIGGFAGLNVSSRLKLKYEENGRDIKQTTVNAFENNVFVYGVDAYVGWGSAALFGRMHLNDIFKSGSVDGQYVSFGLRFK